MLCVNKYKKEYVDACRSTMEAQLSAYKPTGGPFERLFLNNLVLVLDHYFVHRTRALEGKDGNALNEVRMLSNSIMQNRAVMTADKTIKYDPAKSALQVPIGQEIAMSVPDFTRLFKAFFAEIEAKFMEV